MSKMLVIKSRRILLQTRFVTGAPDQEPILPVHLPELLLQAFKVIQASAMIESSALFGG